MSRLAVALLDWRPFSCNPCNPCNLSVCEIRRIQKHLLLGWRWLYFSKSATALSTLQQNRSTRGLSAFQRPFQSGPQCKVSYSTSPWHRVHNWCFNDCVHLLLRLRSNVAELSLMPNAIASKKTSGRKSQHFQALTAMGSTQRGSPPCLRHVLYL